MYVISTLKNVKLYLQLQIESEERLHDLTERVTQMDNQRKELITKLEDKQRELDDLSFRLEEETITKTDLEVITCSFLSDFLLFLLLQNATILQSNRFWKPCFCFYSLFLKI